MTLDDAIATLRSHKAELRALGVRRAAIFGSVARGAAGPKSDLDVMIELDSRSRLDVFAYAGIKRHIEELFPGKVDVVNRDALKRHLKGSASRDAIYAF